MNEPDHSEPQAPGRDDFRRLMDSALEGLSKTHRRGGELEGPSTGYWTMDRELRGLPVGGVTLLYGPPGVGKTLVALRMAAAAAETESAVRYLSLAETPERLVRRLLLLQGRIQEHELSAGTVPAKKWEKLTSEIERMGEWDLRFSALHSVEDLSAFVPEKGNAEHTLVIVDGLGAGTEERNAVAAALLADFARTSDTAVVALVTCAQGKEWYPQALQPFFQWAEVAVRLRCAECRNAIRLQAVVNRRGRQFGFDVDQLSGFEIAGDDRFAGDSDSGSALA